MAATQYDYHPARAVSAQVPAPSAIKAANQLNTPQSTTTLNDYIARLNLLVSNLGDVGDSLDRSGDRLRGATLADTAKAQCELVPCAILDQLAAVTLQLEYTANRLARAAERISETL